MSDSCGVVGSIYTNPIVAVPMGGLSTISLNLSIGASFIDKNFGRGRSAIPSFTKMVRTEDLICPTWGLANSTEGSLATVGPPFNPIIHPPSELINFDPAWKQCTRFVETGNAGGFYMYEVYDPPRALSPVAGIAPSPTPADPITPSQINARPTVLPPAKPADSVSPTLPEITVKPSLDPNQSISPNPNSPSSVDPGQESPSGPERLPWTNAEISATEALQTPSSVRSPPSVLQDSKKGVGGILSFDKSTKPSAPTALPSNHEPSQYTDHGVGSLIHSMLGETVSFSVPMSSDFEASPAGRDANQHTTQGLGEIIYSAFGSPNPAKSTKANGVVSSIELPTSHSTRLIFTIGGSTITVDPSSAIPIGGTIISPGGQAATIDGTSISMGPSGLKVGTSLIQAQSAASDPMFVSAAGQVATFSNPSAFAVGGTTLSVGGDPVTQAHTIISLAPSGKLVIKPEVGHNNELTDIYISQASNPGNHGSDNIAKSGEDHEMAFTPAVFTIAGATFAASPSAFSIDGTTLSPGGAGITVSGTHISLAPSGHLVIGSSTAVLSSLSILTVAGNPFTASPSTFSIDSTTLSAGGAGITISGTPITIGPAGNLIVGSNTVMLSQYPTDAPPPSTYTIDGQTFVGNASALLVDGNTLLAGGAGLTISGTPVSLEASGTLRVGSSDIPLATNGTFGQGGPEEFTGAQGKLTTQSARALLGAMVLVVGIIEVTAMGKL